MLFSTGLNLPASNTPALASTGTMIYQLLVSTIPVLKVSTEYCYHPRHMPVLLASNMPALTSTGAKIRQLLVSTIPVLNVGTGPALKVSTDIQY